MIVNNGIHHRRDMDIPTVLAITDDINPTIRHDPPPRRLPLLAKGVSGQKTADRTLKVRTFHKAPIRSHPLQARTPPPDRGDRPTDPHKGALRVGVGTRCCWGVV